MIVAAWLLSLATAALASAGYVRAVGTKMPPVVSGIHILHFVVTWAPHHLDTDPRS